jgi:biopolymer transport protein ExbD
MELSATNISKKTILMAEITTTNSNKQKNGVKRMIKKSTRVDLTPMVDLGFLLVTFFVFTTTMAQPKAMNILVPNDKDATTDPICETCALTVVLGDHDKIFYYEGRDENAVYKETNYSSAGIRDIIIKKKKAVIKALGSDRMILIIKASDKSSMKNMVDMLDESAISRIKRYYMADLNWKDKKMYDL